MMMTAYKRTLSGTMGKVDRDGQSVTNERKYLSDNEDPVSATRAYQYRREMAANDNYSENTTAVRSLLETRDATLQGMADMARTVKVDILGAITGTTPEQARNAYAQQIDEIQKSMVQSMNTSYGGRYIFGGSSVNKVPYELDADDNLIYRGVAVNSSDTADQDFLKKLDNETLYVDLGFGLEIEASGKPGSNSAFNMVSNGVSFLGYGVADNGESVNLIQLCGDLAEEIRKDNPDFDKIRRMSENFDKAMDALTVEQTKIGADMNFMDTNLQRLEDVNFNLTKKTNATEYISEAEAITNFNQSQYTYQAALQIGSQILSHSFLDYMR